MAVSKRIQVLLKPHLTKAVEDIAEQEGETLSRMTAILVAEALTARGVHPSMRPVAQEAISRLESAELEVEQISVNTPPSGELTWTQKQHQKLAEAKLRKAHAAANASADEYQEELDTRVAVTQQKLQLMQELMEQLKSM